MLRKYHQILWSRELPCGEKMELTDGKSRYYLKWKDFYFGSDSILVSFRHSDKKALLDEVKENMHNLPGLSCEPRCPYHPRMMLKVIIYAYMNNIYSCRRIEPHQHNCLKPMAGQIMS